MNGSEKLLATIFDVFIDRQFKGQVVGVNGDEAEREAREFWPVRVGATVSVTPVKLLYPEAA